MYTATRPWPVCYAGARDSPLPTPRGMRPKLTSASTVSLAYLLLDARCSRVGIWRRCLCSVVQHVQPFATPWTLTCQAPLSLGLPRQEYWSGLPFPPPGDLLHPGIKTESLASPVLSGGFCATWEATFTAEPSGKRGQK